ncbi:hypothetical protein Q2941_11255 [Bradyrhizobium sp. UFLA05-153]
MSKQEEIRARRVARFFQDRWFAIWHSEDEPIAGRRERPAIQQSEKPRLTFSARTWLTVWTIGIVATGRGANTENSIDLKVMGICSELFPKADAQRDSVTPDAPEENVAATRLQKPDTVSELILRSEGARHRKCVGGRVS